MSLLKVNNLSNFEILAGYKISIRSNLDFEFFEIPLDENTFTARTIKVNVFILVN